MPLVPAKCTECGGEIEVNNEKKLGVCKHCGQPFVVEEAINNYNTYNNYNTTNNYNDGSIVNIVEGESKETLLKNAEIALKIENYDLAKENFEILTKRYPDEYKGWWGLIQSITKNFTYYDLSIDELNQFYSYSIKLASDDVIVELKKQYKEYLYIYSKSGLKLQHLTLNKTKQEYSESYDQIKEKIETLDKKHNDFLKEFNDEKEKLKKEIAEMEKEITNIKTTKKVFVICAIIVVFEIFLIISAVKSRGESEMLIAFATFGGIAGFICLIIDTVLFFSDNFQGSYYIEYAKPKIDYKNKYLNGRINTQKEYEEEYLTKKDELMKELSDCEEQLDYISSYMNSETDLQIKSIMYHNARNINLEINYDADNYKMMCNVLDIKD